MNYLEEYFEFIVNCLLVWSKLDIVRYFVLPIVIICFVFKIVYSWMGIWRKEKE